MPALLVPADPSQPVKVIDLKAGGSHLDVLQEAIGGTIAVQEHVEGDIWLHDEGRIINLPINVRVNHWMINTSHLAHQHLVNEMLIIYGDVVITGPVDRQGDETPVRQDLIDHFQSLNLTSDAMKDWDIRSTQITIIELPGNDTAGADPDAGDYGLSI
jgi:hypothetical protein